MCLQCSHFNKSVIISTELHAKYRLVKFMGKNDHPNQWCPIVPTYSSLYKKENYISENKSNSRNKTQMLKNETHWETGKGICPIVAFLFFYCVIFFNISFGLLEIIDVFGKVLFLICLVYFVIVVVPRILFWLLKCNVSFFPFFLFALPF